MEERKKKGKRCQWWMPVEESPVSPVSDSEPVNLFSTPSDSPSRAENYQLDPLEAMKLKCAYLEEKIKVKELEMQLATKSKGSDCDLSMSHSVIASLNTLALPKSELPVFGGNPMDYLSFMSSFKHSIEAKTEDPTLRLHYLVQYTRGEPNKLIKGCLASQDQQRGYDEAMKLLEKNFGQKNRIATTYLDSIKGPSIKSNDAKALSDFAVSLQACNCALRDLGQEASIDVIRGVVRRLPPEVANKWRVQADYLTEELERNIIFEDVVSFIQKQARIANHPIFGTQCNEQKGSEKSSFMIRKNSVKKCYNCDSESHTLSSCDNFLQKSLDERVEFVKKKGLCFDCLGHHKVVECKKPPSCTKCGKKHVVSLHADLKQKSTVANVTSSYVKGGNSDVIALPILPVKVKALNGSKVVITNALLDPGSNVTFCTEELVKAIGVKGKSTQISLTTMERSNSVSSALCVGFEICGMQGEEFVPLNTVLSRQAIPVSQNDIAKSYDVQRWPHLSEAEVIDVDVGVGLLVGNDNAALIQPNQVLSSEKGGPFAIKTVLGWTLNGPLGRTSTSSVKSCNFAIAEAFQKYVELDFSEKFSQRSSLPIADQRALDIMDDSVSLSDGHYHIALPLKDDVKLPNNKPLAEHRLQGLERRLSKDQELKGKYDEYMNSLVQKGIAEKVSEETSPKEGSSWYLPHHPVFHPQKPGKLRVVFDCSAKYQGVSLNSNLLQGPDLNSSLVSVLTLFRERAFAVSSDIEGMFNQVFVKEDQRSFLKYLWRTEEGVEVFRMKTHIFGAISSPSVCIYALQRTAKDFGHDFPEVVRMVNSNFYVDDCLFSVTSEELAVKAMNDLRALLKLGGFRLTKWSSNSPLVRDAIPVDERTESSLSKTLDFDQSVKERALGLVWNTQDDNLGFRVKVKDVNTRRGILSVMSSLYDPLGFLAPFVLPVKVILQDLCRVGISWDDIVPSGTQESWEDWLSQLSELSDFSVPRVLVPEGFEKFTARIHTFSDASEIGYGAVSFLRLEDTVNQRVHVSFLCGKSRVTPLKHVSIPRLELTAAVVATRLCFMMSEALSIPLQRSLFWTDSTSVLLYLRNESKRFHTFVANRVSAIREKSNPDQWRYVGTKDNPADDASRGITAQEMLNSPRWLMGPDFLWKNESEWPKTPVALGDIEHLEVKRSGTACVTKVESAEFFDFQRHSSWDKLVKVFGWVKRFCTNSTKKTRERTLTKFLSCQELQEAEQLIVKCVQRHHFDHIEIGKCRPISKLDPIIVDGIIRVGGRLSKSSLSYDQKHPMLLPKNSHVSVILLEHLHKVVGHMGKNAVLAEMRKRFWIMGAGQLAKHITSKCVTCRRYQSSFCGQKMADLPTERSTEGNIPFENVGMDYFGPFIVRRGRSEVKRYGVIFTCMSTRAVHLEVAESLDSSSCINAIRRFISRRGLVKRITSDNGTNLVGAERELREHLKGWNENNIHEKIAQRGVEWSFNPPGASHFGGSWERMIRSVRKILYSILREQPIRASRFGDEVLHTLMCEVEMIINNRPLTRVSLDPNDLDVLTPNHLLLLGPSDLFPPGLFDSEDNFVRKRWKQVQYLANIFWKRWVNEYLSCLQERQKWLGLKRNLQVDDIVLIADNNLRGSWLMGKVVKTFPDKNGVVRSVELKTKHNNLIRPIHKLCLVLEADMQ